MRGGSPTLWEARSTNTWLPKRGCRESCLSLNRSLGESLSMQGQPVPPALLVARKDRSNRRQPWLLSDSWPAIPVWITVLYKPAAVACQLSGNRQILSSWQWSQAGLRDLYVVLSGAGPAVLRGISDCLLSECKCSLSCVSVRLSPRIRCSAISVWDFWAFRSEGGTS